MEELKGQLTFNGTTLEKVDLGHPRTVCTAGHCIAYKMEDIDENQKRQMCHYRQHCHDPCNCVSGVDADAIGAKGLYNCPAMSNGTCTKCGHMWNQHMNLRYELKSVTKSFISPGVQQKIADVQSEREKMVIYKKELDDKIGEFQKEHDDILQMSAQFGAFLKKNAIIPYNDAVADYLDFYINEEAQKDDRVRNSFKIEKLRRSKASYEQERTILDKTLSGELKAAGRIPTTEEVKGMIDSLFKLKHFGKGIKGVFNSLEKGEKFHPFNQVNVNILANRGRSK